jgi:hypothetical protein
MSDGWIPVSPTSRQPASPPSLPWSLPLPSLPPSCLAVLFHSSYSRLWSLRTTLWLFPGFPFGGAMSHPKTTRGDNDADDGGDGSHGLQSTHTTIHNAGTGSASATFNSQPNEGPTLMFPSPTTTASAVYILPLSTSIPIRIFPPSITASTDPSYIPTYHALPDGSLLTPLYTKDLFESNARLLGGSALLTLFIINVLIATTFLHRAQLSSIKDKSLFYLLLASQIMGPVAFASLLVPFFTPSANCTMYV